MVGGLIVTIDGRLRSSLPFASMRRVKNGLRGHLLLGAAVFLALSKVFCMNCGGKSLVKWHLQMALPLSEIDPSLCNFLTHFDAIKMHREIVSRSMYIPISPRLLESPLSLGMLSLGC